jgi:hypothetical protein
LAATCEKMENYALPKWIMDYNPDGKRNVRRPRRRGRDSRARTGLEAYVLELCYNTDDFLHIFASK